MSTSDYSFGVSNPTIDKYIQKPYPAITLAGTETNGGWTDIREIAGVTWIVSNAVYNAALGGFVQQNTSVQSCALLISQTGTVQQATAAAGAASPIVWTLTNLSAFTLGYYIFNVRDYGAVGNGVTDDTTAINNAIAAAAAVAGIVYFPPGFYKVSSTLLLAAPAVAFWGAGPGQTLITSTADPILSVTVNPANDVAQTCDIRGIKFQPSATNRCILIANTTTSPAQPVRIENCAFDCRNYDNTVSELAVQLQFVYYASIVENYFQGPAATSTNTEAISIESSAFVRCAGNHIRNYGTCIKVTKKSGSAALNSDFVAVGNTMEGCSTGINLDASYNDTVSGNTVDVCYGTCIIINDSAATISANQFTSTASTNSGVAAVLFNSCDQIAFSGNSITHNSTGNIGIALGGGGVTPGGVLTIVGNDLNCVHHFSPAIQCGANIGTGVIISNNAINVSDNGGTTFTYDAGSISAQFGFSPALVVKENYGNNVGNSAINPVGTLSAPAIPTSTTWLFNPFPYEVDVYISGGTVTAIDIAAPGYTGANSVGTIATTGLTSGRFTLEPGMAIRLTYSVAPTWVWVGR